MDGDGFNGIAVGAFTVDTCPFQVLASTNTMVTVINGITVGGLNVFGGAASESLELHGVTISANLTVNLTNGNNSMLFTGNSGAVSKTTLLTGTGRDIVELRNVAFGTVNNIDTGSGMDTVTLSDSSFVGGTVLATGAGNDTVTGSHVEAPGGMHVNTGNNADTISLD